MFLVHRNRNNFWNKCFKSTQVYNIYLIIFLYVGNYRSRCSRIYTESTKNIKMWKTWYFKIFHFQNIWFEIPTVIFIIFWDFLMLFYTCLMFILMFYFSFKVFFYRHWQFTGQQGKGGDHLLFHSTTSTQSKHWDIYLKLCMWDEYHAFLIATLVFRFTILTNYYLIDWLIDWLMMQHLFAYLINWF